MSRWSLSNPTMNPAMTSNPARCSVCTAATRSRFRFWSLCHSLERLDRRGLDADEISLNPASDHQCAHLRVVGKVHGRLGEKADTGLCAPPPINQFAQQHLGPLPVADEIVIHDEDHVLPAAPAQRIQLGNQLRRGLVAGHAPFITTMSQNSQSNGQPRENCTDIVT